jgi:hypothetical protein
VEREELVERVRRDDACVRLGQLRADDQRLDPAQAEEGQRRDEVKNPDLLVVDGRDPVEETGPLLPDPFEPPNAPLGLRGVDDDCYRSVSR